MFPAAPPRASFNIGRDIPHGTHHKLNLNDDAPYAEHPGIVSWLGQSLAQYREYLATFGELNALSDRLLADIGLSRLDTREIARAAVYAS